MKAYKIAFGPSDRHISGETVEAVRARNLEALVTAGVPKEAAERQVAENFIPQNNVERLFVAGLFKDALGRSKDPVKDFKKFAVWADELEKPLTEILLSEEQMETLRESFSMRVRALAAKNRCPELFTLKAVALQITNPAEVEVK